MKVPKLTEIRAMITKAPSSGSFPALRYRDVGFAASWLCMAFGFERHATTLGDDGRVNYAELASGNTVVILGAIGAFEADIFMRQPDEIGGAETQCSYFVVSDLDSHYARAREAGANIIVEIKAHPNGSRGYTCADHEGHLWNFGTYDPSRQTKDAIRGAAAAQSGGNPVLPIGVPKDNGFSWRSVALARITTFVFGAILALASVASWQPTREAAAAPALPRLDARAIKITHQLVAFERTTRRIAERRSASARNELVQERALRAAAEETAEQLKQQLSGERRAKDLAVSTMILPRQKLTQTKYRFGRRAQRQGRCPARNSNCTRRCGRGARGSSQAARHRTQRTCCGGIGDKRDS